MSVTTAQKRQKAEELMKEMDKSSSKAISESKKSFISLHENASDFSTVKGEKLGNTSVMDYQPLQPILQVDSETVSVNDTPGKSRFREKSSISNKSNKKSASKQPSQQLLDGRLDHSYDYSQTPCRELTARHLRDVPRS